jgi:hypothetical protein
VRCSICRFERTIHFLSCGLPSSCTTTKLHLPSPSWTCAWWLAGGAPPTMPTGGCFQLRSSGGGLCSEVPVCGSATPTCHGGPGGSISGRNPNGDDSGGGGSSWVEAEATAVCRRARTTTPMVILPLSSTDTCTLARSSRRSARLPWTTCRPRPPCCDAGTLGRVLVQAHPTLIKLATLERRVHPRRHACLSSRPRNTLSSAPRPQRLATLVGGLAPGRARAGRPVGEHIHLGGDEAVGEVLNGDVALVAMMWVVTGDGVVARVSEPEPSWRSWRACGSPRLRGRCCY